MDIPITRREVLNNLIRFKNNLLEMEETDLGSLHGERSYAFLVNRHTGDIRFTRNTEVLKRQFPSTSWEELHLSAEDQGERVHFHFTDLEPNHLDPLAVGILVETLDVLNYLASLYLPDDQTLPENAALEHLADLHISVTVEKIESLPGWSGPISRMEAEKILSNSSPGTYLLRMRDKILKGVSETLAESNQMHIKLYVLTFVKDEREIGEYLLLKTQWGWTLVRDESDLSLYEYHAAPSALIRSLNLRTPI
jgi:hypothetical protein